MRYIKGLALTLCSILSFQASAVVITETVSFARNNSLYVEGGEAVGNAVAQSTKSKLVALNRFDASLGVLTDVSISYLSGFQTGFDGYSRDNAGVWQTTSHTAVSTNRLTVRLTEPAVVDDVFQTEIDGSCSKDAILPPLSCSTSDIASGSFDGVLDLTAFTLADFIGNDSLEVRFNNYARIAVACESDIGEFCWGSNTSNWSGKVTVAYTYDEHAVPAPVGLAIFAIGILALVTRVQRQRR